MKNKKKKYKNYENFYIGFKNRLLQSIARGAPGHSSLRVWLHRYRGVHIGKGTFIGTDVIIDSSTPYKIHIGNNVIIGMRTTLIGHFGNMGREHVTSRKATLVIEDDVFIGPGVILLPNIHIHKGAVIDAGSVVSKSVPPNTMVQGNPAVPVATCGIPLTNSTPMWEFYRNLKPIKKKTI